MQSYPIPWKGQLVLDCKKCQKKLKRSKGSKPSKAVKRRARRDEEDLKLRVVEVACLKIWPKGGIRVCTQGRLDAMSAPSCAAGRMWIRSRTKAQHSMTLRARPANEVSL